MQYERVVAEIEAGRLKPAYLLVGSDEYQKRAIVQALRGQLCPDGLGEAVFEGARVTAADLVTALETVGFGGGRLVVTDALPPEPTDLLVAYLGQPAPGSALVIRCADADGRRRVVKRLGEVGLRVDCSPPPPADAVAWLRSRGLDPAAAELLAARSAPGLDFLQRELDKLEAYGRSDRQAVEDLVAPSREERVFDLLDLAFERRPAQARRLLQALLLQGEEPLGIHALLVRQVRLVLQVGERAASAPPERLAAELGAHPFVVRKAIAQARRFRAQELTRLLEALWEAEWLVKTGRRDPGAALELVLARLAAT